jgi:hypothetical protein
MLEAENPKRRRATALKYIGMHEARSMVRASRQALGQWQIQLARIRACMHVRGHDVDALKREAGSLLPLVVACRVQFEQAVAVADPVAARHGLVRDIENAFRHLEGEIVRISSPGPN